MDCLQGWPEQVVRVQALSDSGLMTIPDVYVKPPAERPSIGNGGAVTSDIPVIELGGLAEGAAECRATIRAVADACSEWGFFQVVNHGVSPDLVARVREVWRAFFHLPMEEKQAYANDPKTYEGYGSRLGVDKGAILDWGDYFFLHLLPNPSRTRTSGLRCHRPADELAKLCGTLMKVLSISLGLDAEQLQTAFGGDAVGACLRVNYYPRCPQPELTLRPPRSRWPHDPPRRRLRQGSPSPQRRRLGHRPAHPRRFHRQHRRPDSGTAPLHLVVVLSNAVYRSVEHRVVVNAAQERLSLAFFYNPRSDVAIAPVSKLVTAERPQLYRPMTFDEYRLHIRKKGPKGKSQVESLKAQC
ncbi:2OG-Fe(II) oxygenase superfamily [Musa troglodytarum]|uniref:2OG-Fe(II) oxygenase superfamily n=1 Tax=Musa troglodytarum TaxID=320322 RepID=A0A9E7ETG5_9LILI|nr:2OG-Fe(II) oxygenase superfamily [Musa troglodytarum]